MSVELRGKQIGALVEALASAFPTYANVNLFTTVELNLPLSEVSAPGPHSEVLLALVQRAMAHGEVDQLVAAALHQRPKNPKLSSLAPELILTSTGLASTKLQRMVLANVPVPDAVPWRERMAQLEDSVCRLENAGGDPVGSGFLISPDLVLTNKHVTDGLGDPRGAGSGLARFAMKLSGRREQAHEQPISFARDWLIESSPINVLDFALVRLKAPTDRTPVPKPMPYLFNPGDIYFILHHPQGAPLKVSAGTYYGMEDGGNRVAYTVNTEPGSSGSPVFTMGWGPIALHRGGGAESNSGVPLQLIAANETVGALWR